MRAFSLVYCESSSLNCHTYQIKIKSMALLLFVIIQNTKDRRGRVGQLCCSFKRNEKHCKCLQINTLCKQQQ